MFFRGSRKVIQNIFCLVISTAAIAAIAQDKATSDVVRADFSGNYPMLQTSTSDSRVQINVLVPRLKEYDFIATPVAGGNAIEAKISVPAQDPQKLLHEKALKIQFSGLKADTEYNLEMLENFRGSKKLVDRRRFKTLSPTSSQSSVPLRMTSVSCMCDENKYRPYRENVWSNALNQKPDLMVMTGDQTYVDSFDYVERGKASALDIWMRYFRSFDQNPLTRAFNLVPVYSTWDDHDTGINDGNGTTPSLPEAHKAFDALYGTEAIPGFVEKALGGHFMEIKIKGQNLFILDARSHRKPFGSTDRYSHFGKEQEDWFFSKVATALGPIHIFKGDMWGTPSVMSDAANGKAPYRLTESFFGDHPQNYRAFMQQLFGFNKAVVFHSGDIHFSEVLKYGPDAKVTSFLAPFPAFEVTSSPAHSIIFTPAPGEAEFWPNPQRITAARAYNTVTIESSVLSAQSFRINVSSYGVAKDPLFKTEQTLSCETPIAK